MSTSAILVVLGDEHVGPFAAVWSAEASTVATRHTPQCCDTIGDAMQWAEKHFRSSVQPRAWPWVKREDGRVLSPAYLRGYVKAMSA